MPKHYRAAGKKKEGNAAKYITRSKAVKHLQVSLSTFRKLCTLKGVFPREPKKKIEGNHKTYYLKKDILFLQHDPLLEKFRVAPPHLSPFVDNEAEVYVPEYTETMEQLQAVAGNQVLPMPGLDDRDLDNPHNLLAEGVTDGAEANEIAEKKHKLKESDKQYQDELKMGLQGFTYSSASSDKNLPTPAYVARYGEPMTVDLEQVAEDDSNLIDLSVACRTGHRISMAVYRLEKKGKTNRVKERKRKAKANNLQVYRLEKKGKTNRGKERKRKSKANKST